MKEWQKWTMGCLAGCTIPLVLVSVCVMATAVAGTTPQVQAVALPITLPAAWTATSEATATQKVAATELPTYGPDVVEDAQATAEAIRLTSVAPHVDPALGTAVAQATLAALQPTKTPGPTETEEPTEPPFDGIYEGTWLVGDEVKAGTYRGNCTYSCYWERLSCLTGELDCIITNDWVTSEGPFMVTVLSSDYAFYTDTTLEAMK